MEKIRYEIDPRVIREFEIGVDALFEPIRIGNINKTILVSDAGNKYILQELNPIFSPAIHFDILAVTEYLDVHGFLTPKLKKTSAGDLWLTDEKGHVWRMYNYIAGDIYSRAPSTELCFEAGRLAGQFHQCLAGLDYEFQNNRLGVHDFDRHISHLKGVIETHKRHQNYDKVADLASKILRKAENLAVHVPGEKHVAHGDLKLNNFVFSPTGEALCLIDLDTLGPMDLLFELGDAFRSWCNPAGENALTSEFDIDCFREGIHGYWSTAGSLWKKNDFVRVPYAAERISLELSARYCADALEESYFAWDREKYAAASEHNLQRALGQYNLSESVSKKMGQAQEIVEALLVE